MFIYILQSTRDNRYYIGSCENIIQRLKRHNAGQVRSTKYGVPWNVVHEERFENRRDAYKRELQIKSYKGGEAFRKLIQMISV